jgi:hypothetical protein
MKTLSLIRLSSRLLLLVVLISPGISKAQFFKYGTGDLMAGFRKTGQFAGDYELVVNAGNVVDLLSLADGSEITISRFSPAQLSDAFPDSYDDLQWSVSGTITTSEWTNKFGVFSPNTCWYTVPRTNVDVQSQPPKRFSYPSQGNLNGKILGLAQGATSISSSLAITNADNNAFLVREPVTISDNDLTAYIGDVIDPTFGDFGGSTLNFSVENTTPSSFSSPQRTDLYQSVPASSRTYGPFVDPITHLTNGPAYFIGYFTLNPSGTMTFTRASTNTVTPPPPPPPAQLAIGRAGTSTIISFGTTNGATYTLYYTNAAGVSAPISSWASLPLPLTGDGSTKSFNDNSGDADRVYRVGAH